MKFILTKELGRLAKWLRILGYDTAYFNQENLSSLVIQALSSQRIILTRNHRLAKQYSGIKIMVIQKEKIKEQTAEVLKELRISPDQNLMFTRCIICNEALTEIEKEKVKNKVPEYVFKTQEEFITCPKCNRIYWQGTHWGNVKSLISQIQNPRISADKNQR